MTMLVTGAAGFLGSHVARQLVAAAKMFACSYANPAPGVPSRICLWNMPPEICATNLSNARNEWRAAGFPRRCRLPFVG